LHLGDARNVLATMPDGFAHCIVTSPPYWAKRDYGVTGQYGHEPDPVGYIETLRSVFREARRVLADDGTCWLNLGDSYSAGSASATGLHRYLGPGLAGRHAPGMGIKNLLGLPWRVALALQDDGWIVRNAIVWHKSNAMPESVRDRMNCRYELIFLLVKSRYYWFDLDPIRVPHATIRAASGYRPGGTGPRRPSGRPATGRYPGDGKRGGNRPSGTRPGQIRTTCARGHCRSAIRHWSLRQSPSQWPQPWRRVVDPHPPLPGPTLRRVPCGHPDTVHQGRVQAGRHGARPVCGTGTTGLAAIALGRHFTGIELNPALPRLPPNGCTMPPAPKPATATGERHRGAAQRRHRRPATGAPVTGKPKRRPVTGRLQQPCSRPPKPRPPAYDHRPAAGPDRTPRRTQRRSTETRQVRVELPEEPPRLTPEAALALLRVLLKTRAARRDEGDHS
jgi:DNA modification methylase